MREVTHPDDPRLAGPAPRLHEQLRAFVQLANGVTNLHPDDLPGHVSTCASLLGGRDATLYLVDLEQRSLQPFGRPSAAAHDVSEPSPGAGQAYRSETTVRVPEPGHPSETRLWVPLMDSAERLGVLAVVVPADDPVEIWTAFASVVAETVVAKTAYGDGIVRRRRTRELSLAAEMRWSVLPPLTFTSPKVEISGILEPAYDIAGDTFDYAVNGDVLSILVLDAMGHGLEASRMANLAVAEYRRGRRRDRALGQLLHGMDEVIAAQFGDDRFVTGQIAELDLATGRLAVVNAGHPAPLVFRNGADAGDLPCRPCPPMGLGLIRTEESHIDLAVGDVVVFHTDGITESRAPDGEQFGRARFAAGVADGLRHEERPAEILRRVVRAVTEHTSGPMVDDATIVSSAEVRHPSPPPSRVPRPAS
jgi:hypothetical protein